MDQSSAPTFSILIKTVPPGPDERSEFLDAFSSEFHLSKDVSQEVLDCAPVAIFSELSRGQVSDVKPSLKSLSETFDTQFFITSSPVSELPKLTWPEFPDFDDVEPDRTFSGVELSLQDDSVVCPECDHILVLDQSEDRITARKLANISASDTSEEQETQSDDEALEEDLEEELSEELDEDLEEELEEDIEEELEELLDEEERSEPENASSSSSMPEQESTSETQVQESSEAASDTAETATRPTGGSTTNSSPQTSNGSANVFLSGVPDADMDDILDLLTDVRDCSVSEAEQLMDRPITPIQNGVTEEEAKELEERFNEIGVTVNIVHK